MSTLKDFIAKERERKEKEVVVSKETKAKEEIKVEPKVEPPKETKASYDDYIDGVRELGGDGVFSIDDMESMKKSVAEEALFMGDLIEAVAKKKIENGEIPVVEEVKPIKKESVKDIFSSKVSSETLNKLSPPKEKPPLPKKEQKEINFKELPKKNKPISKVDYIKQKYAKKRKTETSYLPESKIMIEVTDIGDNPIKNDEILTKYTRDSSIYEALSTLQLLLSNTKFICADGEVLSDREKLRTIKFSDLNLYFFLFGKNMVEAKQDYVKRCIKCETQNKLSIDLDTILEKAMSGNTKYIESVKNYNINDSIDVIRDRSMVDKEFEIEHEDEMFKCVIMVKDSSLYRYLIVSSFIKDYIVKTFSEDIPQELIANKASQDDVLRYLIKKKDREIELVSRLGRLMFYINSLKVIDKEDPSVVIDIDLDVDSDTFDIESSNIEEALDTIMTIFKETSDEMFTKIGEAIVDKFNAGEDAIELLTDEFKCRRCGHVQRGEIDGRGLFEMFLMLKATQF